MDRTEKLKEMFAPVFEANGVELYELKWITSGEKTLQVSIMKEDGSMDLDTCADVSEQLRELLDREDQIPDEYTLEVCSPGAEREIRDLDALDKMIGAYVFVRLKKPVRKSTEFTGEITEVSGQEISLAYRDKAVTRTAVFSKEDIEFIRMAVRI